MLGQYKTCMTKYATFEGRASRSEYWYFTLTVFLGLIAGATLDELIGARLFAALFLLAHFVPSISATVRRLHDTGRSGWWCLLNIVPLGAIVVLVFLCQRSVERPAESVGQGRRETNQIPGGLSKIEELERLQKLRESGALSVQEFETMKGRLL